MTEKFLKRNPWSVQKSMKRTIRIFQIQNFAIKVTPLDSLKRPDSKNVRHVAVNPVGHEIFAQMCRRFDQKWPKKVHEKNSKFQISITF